jgi:hypothetical protein
MTKRKENYITLPCLANRLGLQHYQIHYWIQTGRIPDGTVRPGSKRKTWTTAQAEMIERWYESYRKLDAGCCGQ